MKYHINTDFLNIYLLRNLYLYNIDKKRLEEKDGKHTF